MFARETTIFEIRFITSFLLVDSEKNNNKKREIIRLKGLKTATAHFLETIHLKVVGH